MQVKPADHQRGQGAGRQQNLQKAYTEELPAHGPELLRLQLKSNHKKKQHDAELRYILQSLDLVGHHRTRGIWTDQNSRDDKAHHSAEPQTLEEGDTDECRREEQQYGD